MHRLHELLVALDSPWDSSCRGWAYKNGAVASAVLVHQTREPAYFDWRWRERPAPALLA